MSIITSKIIPSTSTGSTYIGYVEHSLSSAQILALNSSPYTLINTVESNSYVVILHATIEYKFGGTAYSGGVSPLIQIINGVTSSSLTATNLLSNTSNAVAIFTGNNILTVTSPVTLNNYIRLFTTTAPTTGNGTLNVKIIYLYGLI